MRNERQGYRVLDEEDSRLLYIVTLLLREMFNVKEMWEAQHVMVVSPTVHVAYSSREQLRFFLIDWWRCSILYYDLHSKAAEAVERYEADIRSM